MKYRPLLVCRKGATQPASATVPSERDWPAHSVTLTATGQLPNLYQLSTC
jgi:hypothetical protein